jgi:hypothetical protein
MMKLVDVKGERRPYRARRNQKGPLAFCLHEINAREGGKK